MLPGGPAILMLLCGAVSGAGVRRSNHRFGGDRTRPPGDDEESLMPYLVEDRPVLHKKIYHVELDPLYVGKYPQKFYKFDDFKFNQRCLVCPKDEMVVAKRKFLRAGFSPPELPSICSGKGSTEARIVGHINRGPRPHEQLGPGRYPIYITLIDYSTSRPYRAVQCNYTYEVIVNKCEALEAGSEKVNIACSHENAWGSVCNFSCPTSYRRRGFAKTRCKNDLSWNHKIPKCIRKMKGKCKMTAFGGLFECNNGESIISNDYVMSGTVCKLKCNEGYDVPSYHQHLTTIRCVKGRWNTTTDPLCVPIPAVKPTTKIMRVHNPRYHSYVRNSKPRKMKIAEVTNKEGQ